MTIENETPAERFARSPRPLDFVRVRLYRRGQAEYIRDLLADELDLLFEELGKLRGEGKAEDHPDILECTQNLRFLNGALKDISNGLIEITGPDGY